MAIGSMAYARSRGLRVPEDLGIVGWGEMGAAPILPHRLTTIFVPTTAIRNALVARLTGEPGQDVTVVPTRLEPGETG